MMCTEDSAEPLHMSESLHVPSPLHHAQTIEIRERIESTLGTLSDREARILRQRFGIGGREPRTLEEIGWMMKISRERVRQIEAAALKKLRESAVLKELRKSIVGL